jgi:hypothetical protein
MQISSLFFLKKFQRFLVLWKKWNLLSIFVPGAQKVEYLFHFEINSVKFIQGLKSEKASKMVQKPTQTAIKKQVPLYI